MSDAPEWELLHGSHWDTTERLAIPGGWLVRSVWRKQIAVGQPHIDGSSIVFVPGTASQLAARDLLPSPDFQMAVKRLAVGNAEVESRAAAAITVTIEDPPDAQAEEVASEDEVVEVPGATRRTDAERQAGEPSSASEPHRGRPRK